MPTAHPRYTVTDTAEVREMLDVAAQRWPNVPDRRRLLLCLARAGRDQVVGELEANRHNDRLERQRAALRRARDLIDEDVLLSDAAWQ